MEDVQMNNDEKVALMKIYHVGKTYTFTTTQTDLQKYNNMLCVIVEIFNKPDKNHDAEVLPMYRVMFLSGDIIECFSDELL